MGDGGARSAAAIVARRTASRRAEDGGTLAEQEALASVRRRRVSAEPDARPQGWRVAGGRCRERERRRREAPRREARHRARRKKRASPSPKRRTGPCGWRSAALTRRCCRPGCRAGGALSDEVPGDARAGERDDALREQVQQLVVPPERRGLAVCVPIGAADHLVDPARVRPARGDLLVAGTAAVQQNHVAVLLAGAVQRGPDRVAVRDLLAAGHRNQGAVRAGARGSRGPGGRAGSRGRRSRPR